MTKFIITINILIIDNRAVDEAKQIKNQVILVTLK